MVKKLLIGGAVVVGGYFLYKWIKPKLTAATTTSTSSNSVEYSSGLTPAQMEQAAGLAQKFNPGFDVGGLSGAFGSSPLLRVVY
jgi:hypothetical protein